MSEIAIAIGNYVSDVVNGKRKYLPNAVARAVALMWCSNRTPELSRLAECGGITDASLLHAEIATMVESVTSDANVPEDVCDALYALDQYCDRVSQTRKPVKGWADLAVA